MKTNTDHYKTLLEKEHQLILGELKTVGRKNPDHAGDWEATSTKVDALRADEHEVANKLETYEENQGIVKSLEIRLVAVEAALERIAKGKYGMCKLGDKEIEAKRLEANPAAETCIEHINE